jgi:hypothetical protein
MIILDMVAEDVAFYWNNQKFVDLWDTAVDYVDELMEGDDCTQEAKDALVRANSVCSSDHIW